MSQAASPEATNDSASASPQTIAPRRGLIVAAIAVLLLFIATQGFSLWREWQLLNRELSQSRAAAVIGYPGITPRFSHAVKPPDWFHQEGDSILLWGGWKHGKGHQWFKLAPGDLEAERLSHPMGRDVVQAIDYPLSESGGGTYWGRVPDEADVAGELFAGVETAYPLLILDKVMIVNDVIHGRPILITFNAMAPPDSKVCVYDPSVDGQRLTMGSAGYFHNNAPMFYDRGTESLWIVDGEGLQAVSGSHKGHRLPRLARLAPVSWVQWRTSHPKTRLVVGADRTKALPEL
jgi:hypothetical protein